MSARGRKITIGSLASGVLAALLVVVASKNLLVELYNSVRMTQSWQQLTYAFALEDS